MTKIESADRIARRARNGRIGLLYWLEPRPVYGLPPGIVCDHCGGPLDFDPPNEHQRAWRHVRTRCRNGCWPCPCCGHHHGPEERCADWEEIEARRDEYTLGCRYVVFCGACGYWHGSIHAHPCSGLPRPRNELQGTIQPPPDRKTAHPSQTL